jgi:hypothetical protein
MLRLNGLVTTLRIAFRNGSIITTGIDLTGA